MLLKQYNCRSHCPLTQVHLVMKSSALLFLCFRPQDLQDQGHSSCCCWETDRGFQGHGKVDLVEHNLDQARYFEGNAFSLNVRLLNEIRIE